MLKNRCFQTVVLEKTLRVPWTARRSNQSILKEINPEHSLEGLMLKLQYFDHLIQRADSLEKILMLGKGATEDEMVGHGFGWTPGVGDGQGGLVCCGSWCHRELYMTKRPN